MNAFASELLFPASALKVFFGETRTSVTIDELKSAKLRYGISISAIVYAMRELAAASCTAAVEQFSTDIVAVLGGARGGSRTHTPLRESDFKSEASTVPPPGQQMRWWQIVANAASQS